MLWAVSPDEPEKLRSLRDREALEFPLLLDPQNQTSLAYGLLNASNPEVPHPTAIVVDTEGVVRYVRVDEDYRVRPSVTELLSALDGTVRDPRP